MLGSKLVNAMPPGAQPGNTLKTLVVMGYELGGIQRNLIYAGVTEDPQMYDARVGGARIELADLITQCRLLAEQYRWSWDSLVADGEERFRERMRELAEGRL